MRPSIVTIVWQMTRVDEVVSIRRSLERHKVDRHRMHALRHSEKLVLGKHNPNTARTERLGQAGGVVDAA